MVSLLSSWKGWSISGANMSNFPIWWQHSRWKHRGSCSHSPMQDKNSKQQEYSTLISQLCSVSPPVNFFVAHPGYDLSWATCWPWTCTESCRRSWTMYCLAVYHCLLLRAYQAILPLSSGFASGILVTSWSLAALITEATATASLRRQNASCGFRIAEPLDWEIQRHLWGAFGICIAQLTFQEQGAWSCHHKSCKSARACKCNLHCCLPTLNSLNFTWLQLWEQVRLRSLPGGVVVRSEH